MRKQTKRQPSSPTSWIDRLVMVGKIARAVFGIVRLGEWLIAHLPL